MVDWFLSGLCGALICIVPMMIYMYHHNKKKKALADKAKARKRENIRVQSYIELDRMGIY